MRSTLGTGRRGVPAALFDLSAIRDWCPRCFDGENVAPAVAGLDTYLTLLDEAYHAPPADVIAAASARGGQRRLLGSAYLGSVVPDSAGVHYEVGSLLLERREFEEAAQHFEAALRAGPESAAAHNNLGVALASAGRVPEAIEHFRRAVTLEPGFAEARNNLDAALRVGGAR